MSGLVNSVVKAKNKASTQKVKPKKKLKSKSGIKVGKKKKAPSMALPRSAPASGVSPVVEVDAVALGGSDLDLSGSVDVSASKFETLANIEDLQREVEREEADLDGSALSGSCLGQSDHGQDYDQPQGGKAEAAQALASVAVDFSLGLLQSAFPNAKFLNPSPEHITRNLTAVFLKYDAFPAWLEPFREEVELLISVALLGFSAALSVSGSAADGSADRGKGDDSKEGGDCARSVDGVFDGGIKH